MNVLFDGSCNMKIIKGLLFALAGVCNIAHAAEMVKVEGGSFRLPYLAKDAPEVVVKSFQMDKTAVSNAEFARFLQNHPKWQRGVIAKNMAQSNYLQHWVKKGQAYAPQVGTEKQPVTNVSWFAAHAYCSAQGKRLPTINEWEYAAQASELSKKGGVNANYNRVIIEWYEAGNSAALHEVGCSKPNYWGIHDLHGLIWEWTEDFNSSQLHFANTDAARMLCGDIRNNVDRANHAAFVRNSFRAALKPTSIWHNMGFRCVK